MSTINIGYLPKRVFLRSLTQILQLPEVGAKGWQSMKQLGHVIQKITGLVCHFRFPRWERKETAWDKVDYERAKHRMTTYGGGY